MSEVLPGAEAWSAAGGTAGALVVHGYTGNPSSMRPLAEALAAAGFAVELPRLPGHGTNIGEMLDTTWDDYTAEVSAAYSRLSARSERVVVVGLSMGGTLTCWLAARHPEIAGIVAINPAVEPAAESFIEILEGTIREGVTIMPGVGSDIADPDVKESAYEGSPVGPMISLMKAIHELDEVLPEIRCPALVITSRQDHVVPPTASDHLASRVSGPVERVWLERSYHVATLDYDRPEIEQRTVEFATKVTTA